jgi:uncharacterized protein YlzI (FlbEa/FlbD family)
MYVSCWEVSFLVHPHKISGRPREDGKVIVVGDSLTELIGKVIVFGDNHTELIGKVIVIGDSLTEVIGKVIVFGHSLTELMIHQSFPKKSAL